MLSLACLTLALLVSPLRAQELPPDVAHDERLTDAQTRLDAAVNAYLSGDESGARNELLVLVLDPGLEGTTVQRDARLWLGEVLYGMGELQAAEDTFRTALAYDPGIILDPFVHPPEVVSFFDAVKASMAVRTSPENPTSPTPLPPWALLAIPGGVQFYNQQPVLGSLTIVTVGGLGVTTLGMRLWLRAQDEDPDHFGVQVYDDANRWRTLRTVRAVENTLGFTALGIWGAAVTQGLVHQQLKANLVVGPTGAVVEVRF